MRLQSAFLSLLLLLPALAAAQAPQTLVPELRGSTSLPLVEQLLTLDPAQPAAGEAVPVLPIWSGTSGRLLAVVALPASRVDIADTLLPAYAGAAAWQLAGQRGAGAGVEWRLGNGLRLDARLSQYGFDTPVDCPTGACFALAAAPLTVSGLLGLGWTSPDAAFDLSYGLSWLDLQERARTSGFSPSASEGSFLPALAMPALIGSLRGEETALFARGRWHMNDVTALDLGASYSRSRLAPLGTYDPLTSDFDLDQLSLSLGLNVGSLRGAVIGRVTRSDDPALAGQRWTAVDLGISWRTPWSGELSVGAQNLWGSSTRNPRSVEVQGRTPYIQYRQDL